MKQKWNGIAQHIAAIVLDSTDIVVLSVFSTMSSVSVYSVYLIVISGIKNLILSIFNGIKALFGELWAKQEKEELNRYFGFAEWFVHVLALSLSILMGAVVTLASVQFSSFQSLSHVQLFETPWTAPRQASLSIFNSQSLLKLMSIESVMPINISFSVFSFRLQSFPA